MIELLLKIITCVTVIIPFLKLLIEKRIFNFPSFKSIKKIDKEEIDYLLSKCSIEYQNIINSNLEEQDFYRISGIQTNVNTIPLYSELKNKLGRNFTWKSIKIMQPYLHFTENKIEVKLSRFHKIIGILGFIFGLMCIIFPTLLMIFNSENFNFSETKNWIYIYWLIVYISIGFFSFYSIGSIMMAMSAEKIIKNKSNK